MEVKHRKTEDKCSYVEDNIRQQKRKYFQEIFHKTKFLGNNVLKFLTEVLFLRISFLLLSKDEQLCGDLNNHQKGGKNGENLCDKDALQRSASKED